MMRYCFLVVAVIAASALAGKSEEYLRPIDGMKGFSIRCDSAEKLSVVKSYEGLESFDFVSLTKIIGNEIKVFVTAEAVNEFESVLKRHEIEYTIFVENVAKEIHQDYLRNEIERRVSARSDLQSRVFKYFPRFSEIETYLKSLQAEYSNIVTLLNIGSSYEGKPIYVVKISSGPGYKPAVLIDAGIHAREWIAPSTALYVINQLTANKTNSGLYENVDWYILPSLNPDGYEFTHTQYRMWRKTRSANSGSSCYGTDANRNFELEWMTIGASSNPCSDTYAGKKAFSEKETASLRDFVLSLNQTIKVYLTLHSYGQYLLHPWGYTSDLPDNEPVLRSVAVQAEKALAAVRGTRYRIGSSTNVLYAAAGGSDDWVMEIGGAWLSYTVELPGGGSLGFNPPASQIEPVGFETFEAVKVFGKWAASSN